MRNLPGAFFCLEVQMIIGKQVKHLVKIEPIDGIQYLGIIWNNPGGELFLEGISGKKRIVGLILTEEGKKKKKNAPC